MNELIKVVYANDQPTVSARDLHEFLGIETRYNDWFKRMTEYGFTENHILKLSGADCTAFHGSLFPVALLYIPRLMKIKKDISIHNNPLHICS